MPIPCPVAFFSMDPVTLGYYAAVCAALTAAGPRLGRLVLRLAIGAGVGLVAAALLPLLRDAAPLYP